MKKDTSQSGQALLATMIIMSLLLLTLLTLLTQVQVGNRLVGRQLTYQGQAMNASEAGLADALSWFRRQTTQPVKNFTPKIDGTVTPPIADTTDTAVGIVRTFQISGPGRVMGRYEARYGDPVKRTGVLDVTALKGKTTAGAGSVWQLESTGSVWIQNDTTKAFDQDPNLVISSQTVRTEIQKLSVNLPDGGAAIFAARCGGVNIGTRSKVQGGAGIGVSCKKSTGSITNNGVVTGVTSVKTNSTAGYDIPAVFSVTPQELLGLADVNVVKVSDLPATLPSMSLMVIRGDAIFDSSRPLVGSGILVVFGDLTVTANSNASWSGVIYVTGNIDIREPTLISGAIISAGIPVGGSVSIASSSDVTEVDYDPTMITQINQQMGQYRYSRNKYWVGK